MGVLSKAFAATDVALGALTDTREPLVANARSPMVVTFGMTTFTKFVARKASEPTIKLKLLNVTEVSVDTSLKQ